MPYEFPQFVQYPEADIYVPEVYIEYRLRIVEHDNEIMDPKVWDFANVFYNDAIYVFAEDYDLSANYTVELIGSYTIFDRVLESSEFLNIELLLPARTYEPGPPDHEYFELFDHSMDITEGYSFSLGPVYGKHGDILEVEFSMTQIKGFANFTGGMNNTFLIE